LQPGQLVRGDILRKILVAAVLLTRQRCGGVTGIMFGWSKGAAGSGLFHKFNFNTKGASFPGDKRHKYRVTNVREKEPQADHLRFPEPYAVSKTNFLTRSSR
jgi:hypothetical protein